MPSYLAKQFATLNEHLDYTSALAARLASEFTIDQPRDAVVNAYRQISNISATVAAARQTTGMAAYATAQWGDTAPDFVAKAQEIEAAADAVVGFIEGAFPTVQSTLDEAMDALGITVGQQNALRSQMGANLGYILAQQIGGGAVQSPIIPAAALSGLVTLLNDLATAATI